MIPTYKINMNVPMNVRYEKLYETYKEKLKIILEQLEKIIIGNGYLNKFIYYLASCVISYFNNNEYLLYKEELTHMSKYFDIPLEKLVLGQLCYEMNACCTSVVFKDKTSSKNIHFRTMDWPLEFLRDITVQLDYYKDNKLLYSSITWVGYVGVLTGIKYDSYSVSINFRKATGSIFNNIYRTWCMSYPIGYLVRNALESNMSYDETISYFSKASLISPTYVTMCHPTSTSYIIIRNNDSVSEIKKSNNYLIQTNIDCLSCDSSKDILMSKDRYKKVENILTDIKNTDSKSILKQLQVYPIINQLTIYTTIIDHNKNKIYNKLY